MSLNETKSKSSSFLTINSKNNDNVEINVKENTHLNFINTTSNENKQYVSNISDSPLLPSINPPNPPSISKPFWKTIFNDIFHLHFLSTLNSFFPCGAPLISRNPFAIIPSNAVIEKLKQTLNNNSSNERRRQTLWIGNLPEWFKDYNYLSELCCFGTIESIHPFQQKHFAFINYFETSSADIAQDSILKLREKYANSLSSASFDNLQSIQFLESSLSSDFVKALKHKTLILDRGFLSTAECAVVSGFVDPCLVKYELEKNNAHRTLWLAGFTRGWKVSERFLFSLFSIFGAVDSVSINNRLHSAHVAFFTREDAAVARICLRDFLLHSRPIRVEYSLKHISSSRSITPPSSQNSSSPLLSSLSFDDYSQDSDSLNSSSSSSSSSSSFMVENNENKNIRNYKNNINVSNSLNNSKQSTIKGRELENNQFSSTNVDVSNNIHNSSLVSPHFTPPPISFSSTSPNSSSLPSPAPPPLSEELQNMIDTYSSFSVSQRKEYEEKIKRERKSLPLLSFLEEGGEGRDYYLWKMYCQDNHISNETADSVLVEWMRMRRPPLPSCSISYMFEREIENIVHPVDENINKNSISLSSLIKKIDSEKKTSSLTSSSSFFSSSSSSFDNLKGIFSSSSFLSEWICELSFVSCGVSSAATALDQALLHIHSDEQMTWAGWSLCIVYCYQNPHSPEREALLAFTVALYVRAEDKRTSLLPYLLWLFRVAFQETPSREKRVEVLGTLENLVIESIVSEEQMRLMRNVVSSIDCSYFNSFKSSSFVNNRGLITSNNYISNTLSNREPLVSTANNSLSLTSSLSSSSLISSDNNKPSSNSNILSLYQTTKLLLQYTSQQKQVNNLTNTSSLSLINNSSYRKDNNDSFSFPSSNNYSSSPLSQNNSNYLPYSFNRSLSLGSAMDNHSSSAPVNSLLFPPSTSLNIPNNIPSFYNSSSFSPILSSTSPVHSSYLTHTTTQSPPPSPLSSSNYSSPPSVLFSTLSGENNPSFFSSNLSSPVISNFYNSPFKYNTSSPLLKTPRINYNTKNNEKIKQNQSMKLQRSLSSSSLSTPNNSMNRNIIYNNSYNNSNNNIKNSKKEFQQISQNIKEQSNNNNNNNNNNNKDNNDLVDDLFLDISLS